MSFPIGVFADNYGYEFTIYLLASIFGFASAVLAYFHWREQKRAVSTGNMDTDT